MKKDYWNPYLGGVVLGTMLFLTFAIASQGFGASGTLSRLTAEYLVHSDKVGFQMPMKQVILSTLILPW